MKHIIAKRVPPGDRWSIENDEVVHATLTDCLNAIFIMNGSTKFDIDAQAGEILTLATVGMTDAQAELFFNSMSEHLDNSDRPSKQIIDKSWVKAAINNRKAIYNRLKKKYPDAN